MWSSGGKACTHSMEDLWYDENRAGRLAIILSQTINSMKITAIKDTIDPIEEIVFHIV